MIDDDIYLKQVEGDLPTSQPRYNLHISLHWWSEVLVNSLHFDASIHRWPEELSIIDALMYRCIGVLVSFPCLEVSAPGDDDNLKVTPSSMSHLYDMVSFASRLL